MGRAGQEEGASAHELGEGHAGVGQCCVHSGFVLAGLACCGDGDGRTATEHADTAGETCDRNLEVKGAELGLGDKGLQCSKGL